MKGEENERGYYLRGVIKKLGKQKWKKKGKKRRPGAFESFAECPEGPAEVEN